MHRHRLWLIRAINLDLEGIKFDPHLGRGLVGGYTVTIGLHYDLAVTIEPGRHFPAAVKGLRGQGPQQGLLFLPGLANGLGLPIHSALIILPTQLPQLLIEISKRCRP